MHLYIIKTRGEKRQNEMVRAHITNLTVHTSQQMAAGKPLRYVCRAYQRPPTHHVLLFRTRAPYIHPTKKEKKKLTKKGYGVICIHTRGRVHLRKRSGPRRHAFRTRVITIWGTYNMPIASILYRYLFVFVIVSGENKLRKRTRWGNWTEILPMSLNLNMMR